MNKQVESFIQSYIKTYGKVKLGIKTRTGLYWFNKSFSDTKSLKKFLEQNHHVLSDEILTFIRENGLFKKYVLAPTEAIEKGFTLIDEKLLNYYEYYSKKSNKKEIKELIKFCKYAIDPYIIYKEFKITKKLKEKKQKPKITHEQFKKKYGCIKEDFDKIKKDKK